MNVNVKKIFIKSKKQVFSEVLGNTSSILKGEGYDFLELKEYENGQDVKNIDWVITAKKQKPYVKVFHAQKQLNINIINMLSGSMHFGTKRLKKDLLNEISSLLAFISIKQGDPFVSYLANDKLEILNKKSKKNFAVHDMINKIDKYNCIGKKLSYTTITNEMFKHLKKKSIIFLLGDYFNIKDLNLKLLAKKHEVFAIIIRDKFEEDPKNFGNISLLDPSNLSNYEENLSQNSLDKYKKEVKNNDYLLYKHFQECGIKSLKVYTQDNALSKLMGFLKC